MEKNSNTQIHIIPFDLGCVFIDALSISNSKNLIFAKKFIKSLANECAKNEVLLNAEVFDNLELTNKGKTITRYKCQNSDISDNAICYVKLSDDLYCYILSSGIGIFVLADIEGKAISSYKKQLNGFNIALASNFQKKITQSTILDKFSGSDVIPEYEKIMLQLRKTCWKIVSEASSKKEIEIIRKYLSNINYKAEGLSYVLTIYVFSGGVISESEMQCLMYSSIFSKVTDPSQWEEINSKIAENKISLQENVITAGASKIYFSWSGVGVMLSEKITNYNDIAKSSVLSAVLRSEIYVQSRWFMADNSMDNVNKSLNCSLESLQRIESLTEFCQAELDNEISANMSTEHKEILEQVIETSEVKKVFKSVISQIHTQRKIKEAHYEDKKSKNRLIANLFLAVFTASSLFKTVLDIMNNAFNWKNIVIFATMMIVAIATVIWDYKNK